MVAELVSPLFHLGQSCPIGINEGDGESVDAEGKGRVIFEEVDDLIGEQIAVSLRRDGQKIAEEHLNFGEVWNGA